VEDPEQRRPGRGAYVHDDACLAEALRRKALPRAFKQSVRVGGRDFHH
jgi:predicted RNA-binding protein YlxR (DUF448 family)